MRIVYVVENITGVGGLQRILIDKMNYLAEHTMHEIVLMTVWHMDSEPHFPISPRVRYVRLNVPRSMALLPLALWRFRKHIRRLNPDVTIQLRAVGAFLTLLSGWHGPTIVEMHSARQAQNHRWLYPMLERKADVIVCLTNGDARNYPNARRVEVIPNFSTLPPQVENRDGALILNSEFLIFNSLPPQGEGRGGASPKHVVWMGRDCPEKNLPRLRRIWAEVEKTHPDWTLDIHHHTSDVVSAYANGSIFVLTSNAEGMPMTLLEAQQMGLPVVAFDCPYGPADIIMDGETGYLIPLTVNGSEQEADKLFVDRLTYLMDYPDIRREMGIAARRASQRFNKERIMNQWLKLFADIKQPPSSSPLSGRDVNGGGVSSSSRREVKKTVAVFDFDGTLTTRDTLLLFIRYACGNLRFLLGFLLYSPLIVMMLFRLFPNWKAKERVFSLFFRGMSIERFEELGRRFALREHERIANKPVIEQLRKHLSDGATVYVVSASMRQWVQPFLPLWTGTDRVRCLCTEPEVGPDGRLTGHFLDKNCYGPEKVNRLLEAEPHRDTYTLYAYGDSNGDTEMLAFADYGKKIIRVR